ncbi:unnamed protein product [Heterobilharzia americana]|nr:unnamed protein product [Heterobilharzia americana]
MVCCNTTTTRIDKFGELRGMLGDADDAILTSGRGDEGRVLVFGRVSHVFESVFAVDSYRITVSEVVRCTTVPNGSNLSDYPVFPVMADSICWLREHLLHIGDPFVCNCVCSGILVSGVD